MSGRASLLRCRCVKHISGNIASVAQNQCLRPATFKRSQADGAQIDTAAKQETQMTDMVATCKSRGRGIRR